ncbi:Serine/threonine-protein kinase PknB [Aquisphaera giovannonii]|uniref:non-specific serine/threonine protein kinase n=1 Tax=Aquisphaera giovannonii TaxID=406548 RepID=A0A5B9WCK3_9BACT|nr:serine/threonine-protein kinase [Aquisphaera giovannonii]QEH37681.1 Serine/threonine-protein kinase PknB [Aquisphaera giovannonii]
MPDETRPCDERRLRLSLEDRLDDREQAELAAHLEFCGPCRERLERLAAASRYWGEARSLREGGPDAPAHATVRLDFGRDDDEGDRDEGDGPSRAWLRLLDPPDPDRPGMLGRLGDYEIVEVLGQGGMGVVLKARDPSLDRMVAIKLLNPSLAHSANARRRFQREAKAAAAVGHEHIVAIHAVDEFRGLPYLVMQFIPGRSLQERIDATGPMATREVLRIGMQAARALAAAHAQGVVHRDIKPANILLENCVEKVKLTDFGLARAVDDASVTQSGVIAGTPQYMAPEQARGEPVDGRTDLFALGAVLYAMISGRPPFRAPSTMAMLKRVCEDRHRPVREIDPETPDWLATIVDRLLAKEPADRFQTAGEVADLLEQGLAHLQHPAAVARPASASRAPSASPEHLLELELPSSKLHPRRPRHRLALAACLAVAVMASIGVVRAGGLAEAADLVATILRIKTPEGTLVVKVDDPEVKVEVDDETIVIGGAGPQQIRLKTGPHRVVATRNGQPVRDEIISITRGTRKIVAIDFEADEVATTVTTSTPAVRKGRTVEVGPGGMLKVTETKPNPPLAPTLPAPPTPPAHEGPAAPSLPSVPSVPAPPETPSALPSAPSPSPAVPSVPPVPPAAAAPGATSITTITVRHGQGEYVPLVGRALVWSLAYSPDGKRLVIGQQGINGEASPLRTWDVEKRRFADVSVQPDAYRAVAVSSDGGTYEAGTLGGRLELGTLKADAGSIHGASIDSPINDLRYLRDGRNLVIGTWESGAIVTEDAKPTATNRRDYPGRVFAVAVRPVGKQHVAVGGEPGEILIYEVEANRRVATIESLGAPVESLDYSPDGKVLASAGQDRAVRLWDAESGKSLAMLGPFDRAVLGVRFSPDGRLLAASEGEPGAAHDKALPCKVTLWEVATRQKTHELWAHDGSIYALAFSPDGKTLATGSMDQTVKFWDVASGLLRATIVPGETGASSPPVPVPPVPPSPPGR